MALLEDKCVRGCGEGYGAVEGRCVPCGVSQCSRCKVPLKCDTCAKGYYLSAFGQCEECDEGCALCSEREVCLECKVGATACLQKVAANRHRYSTLVGLVTVGACILILTVTGVLIAIVLCKHRFRVRSGKDVKYKRVGKEMESDTEEELYGQ